MKHPLVSTFSIVAFDASTRELGVAVHSRYFSVGSIVPWAEAEVGAVATQSFVNVSYGPRGLQYLKEGLPVDEVIAKLTSEDEEREYRQLGIVDAEGNVAAFTGKKCLQWAGSKTGQNYTAQGNILAGCKVVENMGKQFESTAGDLAGRLVAALLAGDKAGGDARGRQSAALIVVKKGGGRAGYGDKCIDLRVEDHRNPIIELKRLLRLHRVYSLIDESEDKLTKCDFEEAMSAIKKAVKLNPKIDDAHIDIGILYLKLGRRKEAVKAFKEALSLNPKMENMVKQLPKVGLIDPDRRLFAELGIK